MARWRLERWLARWRLEPQWLLLARRRLHRGGAACLYPAAGLLCTASRLLSAAILLWGALRICLSRILTTQVELLIERGAGSHSTAMFALSVQMLAVIRLPAAGDGGPSSKLNLSAVSTLPPQAFDGRGRE